jgi:deoxyribonuclease-1-like protein
MLFSKKILLVLLFYSLYSPGQVHFCSWNLENFGKSKSDSAIRFISTTLKEFDLVAIVEVVAGNGGAQAVAKLADELNRKGDKWDYCVSDPTSGLGGSSERYAFLWKTSRLKKTREAWLEKNYALEIDREPYSAEFEYKQKKFTATAFHAIPKRKLQEA